MPGTGEDCREGTRPPPRRPSTAPYEGRNIELSAATSPATGNEVRGRRGSGSDVKFEGDSECEDISYRAERTDGGEENVDEENEGGGIDSDDRSEPRCSKHAHDERQRSPYALPYKDCLRGRYITMA